MFSKIYYQYHNSSSELYYNGKLPKQGIVKLGKFNIKLKIYTRRRLYNSIWLRYKTIKSKIRNFSEIEKDNSSCHTLNGKYKLFRSSFIYCKSNYLFLLLYLLFSKEFL